MTSVKHTLQPGWLCKGRRIFVEGVALAGVRIRVPGTVGYFVVETVSETRAGIGRWTKYYNAVRPHSALGGATPDEIYETPPITENLSAQTKPRSTLARPQNWLNKWEMGFPFFHRSKNQFPT